MDPLILLIQTLNGLQYGLLLFLIASGLTVVFGIMGVINLAHGSFYMIGAYLSYSLTEQTGSLVAAVALGLPLALVFGFLIERFFIRYLYDRDHLQQVLLTFGFILIANELQSILWGDDPHSVAMPDILSGSVPLTETLSYPVYRIFLSVLCLALAGGMAWILAKTRLGMRIRAASSNPVMLRSLGVNTALLHAVVFSAGVGLAAFAGLVAAPVESVYPGMGEQVLIISFVVVVIGGIGSIKGAFLGALLIGLTDVYGQVFFPEIASITIYAVMAFVLIWRPAGLFGRA